MEKGLAYGMRKMYKDELENSLDTSWLSGNAVSPLLIKPRLDLSKVYAQQSMNSNRSSVSISQSFNDMSFSRSEFSTPRVVKASHDVKFLGLTSRIMTNSSFFRNKPKIVILKNRVVSQNLLLDTYPRINAKN